MGSLRGCPSVGKHLILISIVTALNFTQLAGLPILSSSFRSGRFLAETDSAAESSRRLDDTVRVDPLDNFKRYRGGYDITNKHYWSSTVFTGVYGYVIAVIWLLCGVVYGGFLIVRRTCKSSRIFKNRLPCHGQCYLQPVLFAFFLTLLAALAIGLVLGGNAKFHSRAKKVIDIIIDTADEASDTIYNMTGAMTEMSSSLGGVDGSSEATGFLSSTSQRLGEQADDIERQASKNRRLIDKGIKIVYIVTTVVISITLIAVIALLVLGALKFRRTLRVLIVLCWIFTVICWLFFGIYFFLQKYVFVFSQTDNAIHESSDNIMNTHSLKSAVVCNEFRTNWTNYMILLCASFAGDTCTALESFQEDPYNNSLSSILPCDELLSAKSVLSDVGAGIYNLVNEVNKNISTSYGNVVQICNPFSPPPMHEYQPWNCPATSIQIGNIPQVLRLLACPDTEGDTCNGGILISANDYNKVEAYSASIQKLLDVYPGMDSLVECQTVKDAFSEILENHCSPLKRYVGMVWAALVFLSVVMLALVLVWIIGAHNDHNHHSFGGSVKPQGSNTLEILESGTAKPSNGDSKQSPEL